MIPAITEIGFGPGTDKAYATLHQATVSLQEMGDRTITTQVRIDGDVAPDFSGWELRFKGERFILPIKEPQAAKDNTTRNSLVDLTFTSWAVEELKRYFFFNVVTTATGTVVADKYKVPIALNLDNFVALFNNVLNYYFHGDIVMLLFGQNQGLYSSEPSLIEIDYTHIWDVLTEMFEIYNVRWYIEYNDAQSRYEIKVGYASPSITDHDFEYGYNGGLLKFERQVQDPQITNILLGRGGEKNLPYRYFKKTDEQNPDWAADPDAIPELANVNFDRIHDINFRWYIRGWVKNTHRSTAYDAGYTLPNYNESDAPAEFRWAYHKGRYEDTSFNPVEYVKDDASILKYGEHWGALDDNDDVYPTIQGVTLSGLGRVDETVAVSNITTDDIHAASQAAAETVNVDGAKLTKTITANRTETITITGHDFSVPTGMVANATIVGEWIKSAIFGVSPFGNQNVKIDENDPVLDLITINTGSSRIRVYNKTSGQEMTVGAIPAGDYRYNLEVSVTSANLALAGYYSVDLTVGCNGIRVVSSTADSDTWKPTFDIWVKNIWQTTQGGSETNDQYSERVWRPILGDRFGNEAKVVFSSGFMSVSEDYEFVIAAYPVVDRSKTITSGGQTYQSEWRITLYKSSAEFDATGLFVPNSTTGGKPAAGDYFYFIGIDMPHIYVEWAEELLNGARYNPTVNKTAALEKVADIAPTWVITFDKVRINTLEGQEYGTTLAERLAAGAKINISDPRFTGGAALTLYVQSITYTWNEPSEGNPYLFPDIEVVLTDKVLPSESVISQIQGDIDIVKSTYAKATDIEQVVRRVAEPLFLKKTGEADSSVSPTTFASRVSSASFRQGDIGGAGWGYYEDGDGDAVLELDKLVVRKEMRVNSLVANQIAYVGGKQILSAAAIECTQVIEDSNGYYCYFDQKQGSVKNLFIVGDIAYGQEFSADNTELRYYRMEVGAVGDNYIYLVKAGRGGTSAPAEGDIIVQYGNTSQVARQFVIIRDVIGGGYERMLSGLNSTTAVGNEYYFAGKQNVSGVYGERWFIGNTATENAEWKNGQLNIKGRFSVRDANGNYQAMDTYMSSVSSAIRELQGQIDGQIQSWSSGEAPAPQEEPLPKLVNDVVDPTTANFPASDWDTDAKKEDHFGDIYVDDTTGQGYRYTKRNNNGVTEYYWIRITDGELAQALADIAALQTSVAGLEYLKTALTEGTAIQGGLILTSLIQLGHTESGVYKVYSGINGTFDETLQDPTKSIAAWYGGEMLEKATWDAMTAQEKLAHTYAKSLFRMDGSGYMAGGNIYWDGSGYGGIPGITWDATGVKISSNLMIETSAGTFETLVNAVQKFAGMLEEETYTENNTTKYRLKVNSKYAGIYTPGWISAGGLSSGGGGGGGGGTTVSWETTILTDTVNTIGLQVGSVPHYFYTKDGADTTFAVTGHTHTSSAITDFNSAVAALIAGSDLATTVAGHTTAINTLNGKFDANGKLLPANLPTLYWADVQVSDHSSGQTQPTFLGVIVRNYLIVQNLGITTPTLTVGPTASTRIEAYDAITALQGKFDSTTGKLLYANLPKLYWANIEVSDTSNSNTMPDFAGIRTRDISIGRFNNGVWNESAYIAKDELVSGSFFEIVDYTVAFESLLAFGDGIEIDSKTYGGYINDPYNKGILISTPKLHLSTQLTFTGEQSDSTAPVALTKGLDYNTTYHAWHLHSNLIVDGFISAGGVSSSGGGGGSSASWETTIATDSDNAIGIKIGNTTHYFYTNKWGNDLDTRVQSLEAGSALTITTTGSGNAVTDVSKSGTVITVTKGATFLTSTDAAAKVQNALTISTTSATSAATTYDGSVARTIYSPTQLVNSNSSPSFTGLTVTNTITGSISGNAATATKLAASKTINGKAFDGSANIVTEYWGAERTITIKDNDGTNYRQNPNIDGSANFDLILPSSLKVANLTATGTITGSLSGNATTATTASKVSKALTISTTAATSAATTYDGSTARTIYSPTQLVNSNSTPTFAGVAITNALSVGGNTTLGNDQSIDRLSVYAITNISGATTLQSTLTVSGAATLNSTLNAKGRVDIGTIPPLPVYGSAKLRVWGSAFIESDLDINGDFYTDADLAVNGNSEFGGSITLTNGNHSVTISLDSNGYLKVDGNMYATGFISAGGVS